MRETRQSGSEGGAGLIPRSYPYSIALCTTTNYPSLKECGEMKLPSCTEQMELLKGNSAIHSAAGVVQW